MAINPYTEARIRETHLSHLVVYGVGVGFVAGIVVYAVIRPILQTLFLWIDQL
jgi:hypothetical protein